MNVEKTMSNVEKVKHIRAITFSPINKINEALIRANGDEAKAVEILVAEKQADANEMANRVANTKIVYSYVHNNRVGAMIVLACQTDFVAKNDAFIALAKNICMHIVSTPVAPEYVDESTVNPIHRDAVSEGFYAEVKDKPPQIQNKIVEGKMKKWYANICLLNQPFVREDTVTIGQLIKDASSTLGEKIELVRFVKMIAQ